MTSKFVIKTNDSTIKASVEWIRVAVKDNLEEEKKLLNIITELFNTLSILAETENTRRERWPQNVLKRYQF